MKVTNIFQGIANKMLTDFDEIQSQIAHAGERGGQREQTLRSFLSKYLPKKYSVGTGQVIDKYGNISPQCDVIIYDAFNCPLILVEDGYQMFPAEAVFGVIEVKSNLNATEMKDAVEKIQKVKQLQRDEPIAGFLFAYRSVYSGEDREKIITAGEAFLHASNAIPSHEKMDLTCVLAEGILRGNYRPPHWGRDDKDNWVEAFFETTSSILLLFLYYLIDILQERTTQKPNLISYSLGGDGGEVWTVHFMQLCRKCGGQMKMKGSSNLEYQCISCGDKSQTGNETVQSGDSYGSIG